MGALLRLDVSNNQLVSDSGWIDVDNHGFKEGDMVDYNGAQCPVFQKTDSSYKVRDISGISVLAEAIKENGAMTSLNLASNMIGSEGAKLVAEAVKVSAVAVVLVPFLCSSDQWLNCCCLPLSTGYEGHDEPQSRVEWSWR
jgi:hypothetical protein